MWGDDWFERNGHLLDLAMDDIHAECPFVVSMKEKYGTIRYEWVQGWFICDHLIHGVLFPRQMYLKYGFNSDSSVAKILRRVDKYITRAARWLWIPQLVNYRRKKKFERAVLKAMKKYWQIRPEIISDYPFTLNSMSEEIYREFIKCKIQEISNDIYKLYRRTDDKEREEDF